MSKQPEPTNVKTAAELLQDLYNLCDNATNKPKRKSDNDIIFDDIETNDTDEMSLRNSDTKSNLDPFKNPETKKQIDSIIQQIISHKDMQAYQLNRKDAWVVLHIFSEYLEHGRTNYDCWELLKLIHPEGGVSILTNANLIVGLMERKVIKFCRELHISNLNENTIIPLLEQDVELDTFFLLSLMGQSGKIALDAYNILLSDLSKGNDDIRAYVMFLKTMFDCYPESISRLTFFDYNCYGDVLSIFYNYLYQTLEDIPRESPLHEFEDVFGLSPQEILILLLVYFYNSFCHDAIPYPRLLNLVARSNTEYDILAEYYTTTSTLAREQFIVMERELFTNAPSFVISEKISHIFKYKTKKVKDTSSNGVNKLVLDENLMSYKITSQTMESLILPKRTKEILNVIVSKLSNPNNMNNLHQWGVIDNENDTNNTASSGINILLHGLPGTGKTYAAGAIANSLNRPLISINANLRSKWFGETEGNLRRLFVKMCEITQQTTPFSPIFILNEADMLIHKRLELSYSSCTETENAIQNIFLEELETFPGIFIATTNLLTNLDDAFSRRFHFKLEFLIPDEDCRRQLWKLYLPSSIPGSDTIDIEYLAKTYILNGGQIQLVVQNACGEAILRSIKDKFLTISDIIKYANLEVGSSFDRSSPSLTRNKQVGFGL